MSRDQEARLAAMSRRYGQSPEAKEKADKVNEAATDWYAFCRKCGKKITGTLAQMREHKHD